MIGLPLPLIAIMILWINLVTDGRPALALSVDPIDPHVMERKPMNPNDSAISPSMIKMMALVSLIMMAGTLSLFSWYLDHYDLVYAQTVAFSTLMLFQMFNVINCRSERHSIFAIGLLSNPKLLFAITISVAMHLAVIYSP